MSELYHLPCQKKRKFISVTPPGLAGQLRRWLTSGGVGLCPKSSQLQHLPAGSGAVGSAAFLSITAPMASFQQQLAASEGLLCPALHFPNIITAVNEQGIKSRRKAGGDTSCLWLLGGSQRCLSGGRGSSRLAQGFSFLILFLRERDGSRDGEENPSSSVKRCG